MPTFAVVAAEWKKSLIGALIPRALLTSPLVTRVNVWATVTSRRSGEAQLPLDKDVPWFRRTLILPMKLAPILTRQLP